MSGTRCWREDELPRCGLQHSYNRDLCLPIRPIKRTYIVPCNSFCLKAIESGREFTSVNAMLGNVCRLIKMGEVSTAESEKHSWEVASGKRVR